MKSTKKTRLQVIIAVVGLLILAYYLSKWIEKKMTSSDDGDDFSFGVGRGSSDDNTPATFPLRKGSGISLPGSQEVLHLQQWLNATGPAPKANYDPTVMAHDWVNPDGKFGDLTEAALYQATSMKQVSQAYYLAKGMQNY